MADNTTLDSGAGGDVLRTQDRSSVKTPVTILDVGSDSTELLVEDGVQGMPSEGVAAENAAVAGNPVLTGGRYDASSRTLGDGDVGAFAVDTAGRIFVGQVVPGTAAADLGKAEDAAHTSGDTGIMALAVRNDTLAALAGTDGDYAPLQVDASGALFIQEGSALDVSAATVTVDLGANNDVTIDNSSIVHAEDTAHNTGDSGVMSLAVRNDTLAALGGTDGDYAPLQVNASGALFIQEGSALDVSAATVTVSATQLDVDDLAPTADGVGAALDTSQIMNGTTSLTPKYAAISASSSGDNTLVAAVVGKKIRVLHVTLMANGTVTVRFEDGAGGTALTGQMDLTAQTGFAPPFCPVGHFETTANTLLNLELSDAVECAGWLVYVEV